MERWRTILNNISMKVIIFSLLCFISARAVAQKVGIGTTTPAALFHVYTDADIWHAYFGGSTGQLQIGAQTNNGAVIQSVNTAANVPGDLYLQRDGGNLAIGTNNPLAKLHLSSISPAGSPNLLIQQSGTGPATLVFKNNNTAGVSSYAVTSVTDGTGTSQLNVFSNLLGQNLLAISSNPQNNISLNGSLTLKTGGTLTPFADGGTNNDVALSNAVVFPVTMNNDTQITGLAGGTNGRIIIIYNYSDHNLILKNQQYGVSSSGNLLNLQGDITVAGNHSIMLLYDGVSNAGLLAWTCIGKSN
jgi:hypothetical protein